MINTSMKRIVDYTKVIEKENEQLRKGRKKKEQFLTMTPKDATIIDYTAVSNWWKEQKGNPVNEKEE